MPTAESRVPLLCIRLCLKTNFSVCPEGTSLLFCNTRTVLSSESITKLSGMRGKRGREGGHLRESQCDLRQCLKGVEHFSKGVRGSHVMQNSKENFALDNGHAATTHKRVLGRSAGMGSIACHTISSSRLKREARCGIYCPLPVSQPIVWRFGRFHSGPVYAAERTALFTALIAFLELSIWRLGSGDKTQVKLC